MLHFAEVGIDRPVGHTLMCFSRLRAEKPRPHKHSLLIPFPPHLAPANLFPISMGLPVLDVSCKWNHIQCGLSGLASIAHRFSRFLRVGAYISALFLVVVVVQLLSCVRLFATRRTAAHQASLSFTVSRSLLKVMSVELMLLSNRLILCCPFLLLPSVIPF